MSANDFARLKSAERAAVIDETDRIFAQRTGINRKLDPKTEQDLVQKWNSIRDEVMRRRKPVGLAKNSGSAGRGFGGLATQAMSAIVPAVGGGISVGENIYKTLTLETPWMTFARSQIGQTELRGSAFNPQILQYILTCTGNFENSSYSWANKHDWQAWVDKKRKAGLMIPNVKPTNSLKYLIDGEGRGANDEGFYWCAAFVNWCLKRAGIAGQNHGLVAKWKNWGTRLKNPHVGAILIMKCAGNSWGHIAFVDKVNNEWVRLGGNQRARAGGPANAVSNYKYPNKVTALLWPIGIKSPE